MEIFGYMVNGALVWIGVAVLFAVIEAMTLGLTTIWFTVGAVAACIVSLLGGHPVIQFITFLLVSILLLYFTKPLAEKKLRIGAEKTNVDALIGKTGIVTEKIAPFNTGLVKVNGIIWTALSDDCNLTFPADTRVKVVRVEGVKLIVSPQEIKD